METHHDEFLISPNANSVKLNKRLEESGWGFFLLMTATLMLLPNGFVPQGTWLIGGGGILLGLNMLRFLNNIQVSRFTVFLGIAVLLIGFASFLGLELPLLALFLALAGLSIIVRSLHPSKQD
jgi:hypothetical protein